VVTDGAAPSREGFALVVQGGMSLRIPSDFDEATLACIVRALGSGQRSR
jgi:hypothetical protein